MTFYLFCLVLASLPASNFASPQNSPPIPDSITNTVPDCARTCFEDSLKTSFASCSASVDLNCLCTHYASTGFTLGETALGCIYSQCSDVNNGARSAYIICDKVPEAVKPTHSTLTVTAGPSASSVEVTMKATPESRAVTPADFMSQETATLVGGPTSTLESLSSTPTSIALETPNTHLPTNAVPSSAALAPASSQSSSTSNANLNQAQIVGLSVAGVAAFTLAIGAILLATCLQKRRKRQNEDSDKGNTDTQDETAATSFKRYLPPRLSRMIDPRGKRGGVGIAKLHTGKGAISDSSYTLPQGSSAYSSTTKLSQKAVSDHRYSGREASKGGLLGANLKPEEIGLAISPETNIPPSPASVQSSRTVSRLLPERPSPILKPAPLMTRPESTMTQLTVFEEDNRAGPLSPARFAFPRFVKKPPTDLTRQHSGRDNNQDSANPKMLRFGVPIKPLDEYLSAERPSLKRDPGGEIDAKLMPSPLQIPPTQAHRPFFPNSDVSRNLSHGASLRSTSTSSDYDSAYVPGYYTEGSNFVGTETSSRSNTSSRYPSTHSSVYPSASSRAVSRFGSGRKYRRDSNASLTSFESADPEETTPPEDEDKQLTPVAESPISGLRYPKIPRTSNQAVPRSPRKSGDLSIRSGVSDTRPAPPTFGLVQTQRGDSPSSDLRLREFHSPNGSQHSISTTNVELTHQGGGMHSPPTGMTLVSPLWIPKLTPSRRGDDLFISVSTS